MFLRITLILVMAMIVGVSAFEISYTNVEAALDKTRTNAEYIRNIGGK